MLRCYQILLLLLPAAAGAQPAPGAAAAPAVAQARVERKVYLKYYAVPVVSVPDARVTSRMGRYFSLRNLAGDTEAGLAADLRRHPGPWSGLPRLTQLKYTVNYNDRGLLSITRLREGRDANLWRHRQTFNLDLNTGARLNMAEELLPERLPELLALGEQKLRLIIQAYLVAWPDDRLLLEKDERLHFTRTTLEEYRLTARGLLFDATNVVALPPTATTGDRQVDFMPSMRGQLNVAFTCAELAPFLKPDSPLQRLRPPAAKTPTRRPGGAKAARTGRRRPQS